MVRRKAAALLGLLLVFVAVTAADARPKRGRARSPEKLPRRPPAQAAPSDPDAVARLGRAYALFRDGRYAEALELAAPLRRARLRSRDYALYVAAQAAFLTGGRARALPLFRELAGLRESRFAPIAAWRIADCLWELGRVEAARREYERLVARDTPGGDRAVALYRIAAAWAAGERRDLAALGWRRLALEHPEHPLAARALSDLAAVGAPPLSARERIARAERLTRQRAWQEALAELDGIADGEAADVRDLRDFWIGETLFRMRRQYARAGELLVRIHERLGSLAPQALFRGARALSRADRDDEAIRWYLEVVRKYPRSEWAAEAQYLAGWLDFNRGRYREAILRLGEVLVRYGGSRFADEALWHLAFSHVLLGECDRALPYLDRLSAQQGALTGGKGRYWRARCHAAMGLKEAAIDGWRELVGRYPFSWYALLARARLAEQGITIAPFGDRDLDASSAPRLGEVDPALGRDPIVARVDELIAAGLTAEAGRELEAGERELFRRYGTSRALPLLFDRYRRAGNFHRPWYLAVVHGGRALALPPSGAARIWWEHAYPRAYQDLVDKYWSAEGRPPAYLWAIMRKESGFDPHTVSYADAIGLLQMIPPTTRRVVEALGMVYTDDLLYDPELNVRVASWYIGRLADKFRWQVPIATGSFNSGPGPVMRWLDRQGTRPMDEFVELVPYAQTREYMKKVTESYARYLYLYDGVDYQQPLVVDHRYVRDEITY